MTMTKEEIKKLDEISSEIIDVTNQSDITTSDFQGIIDVQVRKAYLLGEQKHKIRLEQCRHFMAMLGQTLHEINEPFYTSSDLILYSDDLERLIAGDFEQEDIEEREKGVAKFIEINSDFNF